MILYYNQPARFDDVIDAYRHFDKREAGWLKVALYPTAAKKARQAGA